MWQVKSTTSNKWFLQFSDEFDGANLDEGKWRSGLPWGSSQITTDNYFAKENIEVADHTLKLSSKKGKYIGRLNPWEVDSAFFKKTNRPVCTECEFDYSSAAISTLQKFKNGYFEIRFKTQANQDGICSSFWLYGGKPNEEIDFFELKGERDNQLHIDMHCPKGCDDFKGGFLNLKKNWGGWVTADKNLSEGWNIVSGEWQQDFVKLFLNGEPIAFFKGEFKTAQNIIIGTGPSKTGGPFSPGPTEQTRWPNYYEIDYVRVWSQKDTIYNLQNNYKVFEHTPASINNSDLHTSKLKKKLNFVYDKKALMEEEGTITLLPISYNKYSLSIAGNKHLSDMTVDVYDTHNNKVADYKLTNAEYYILDLSHLPAGLYTINITVARQTLSHKVPVMDLKNTEIQR